MRDVKQMREQPDAFRAACRPDPNDPDSRISRRDIATFGGREWVVLSGPALRHGPQRVSVLDLTAFDGEGNDPNLIAARFASSCPEPFWPITEDETPASIARRIRRTVLYLEGDEGHPCLLTESGDWRWCDTWEGEIIVHVMPGSKAEQRQLQEDLTEEDVASIDAGGRLRI